MPAHDPNVTYHWHWIMDSGYQLVMAWAEYVILTSLGWEREYSRSQTRRTITRLNCLSFPDQLVCEIYETARRCPATPGLGRGSWVPWSLHDYRRSTLLPSNQGCWWARTPQPTTPPQRVLRGRWRRCQVSYSSGVSLALWSRRLKVGYGIQQWDIHVGL